MLPVSRAVGRTQYPGGIELHILTMHLHLNGVGATPDEYGPQALGYNGFAASTTTKALCGGSPTFDGVIGGHAHWPNGSHSTTVYTWTAPAHRLAVSRRAV